MYFKQIFVIVAMAFSCALQSAHLRAITFKNEEKGEQKREIKQEIKTDVEYSDQLFAIIQAIVFHAHEVERALKAQEVITTYYSLAPSYASTDVMPSFLRRQAKCGLAVTVDSYPRDLITPWGPIELFERPLHFYHGKRGQHKLTYLFMRGFDAIIRGYEDCAPIATSSREFGIVKKGQLEFEGDEDLLQAAIGRNDVCVSLDGNSRIVYNVVRVGKVRCRAYEPLPARDEQSMAVRESSWHEHRARFIKSRASAQKAALEFKEESKK